MVFLWLSIPLTPKTKPFLLPHALDGHHSRCCPQTLTPISLAMNRWKKNNGPCWLGVTSTKSKVYLVYSIWIQWWYESDTNQRSPFLRLLKPCLMTSPLGEQEITISKAYLHTGFGTCPILGILNITSKCLLEIISPVFGLCSSRTFTNPWYPPIDQHSYGKSPCSMEKPTINGDFP